MKDPKVIHPEFNKEDAVNALETLDAGRDVLDALSDMIEVAGLEIGDRLPPEIEIAKKLRISRAKVREALTAWQNMGIVTRNKRAGTILRAEISANALHMPLTLKLEAESLLRTHSVRRPLELEAVRLAAQNASVKDRKIIIARSAELDAIFEAGEDWREADYRFHAAIHEATGNPLFGQLITQIHHAFHDIYDAPFGKAMLGNSSIALHTPMAEAIVRGDADEAVRLATEIVEIVEVEVRKVIEGHDA